VLTIVAHIGFVIRDRYRLEERIAAGGVGQVWRAEDLALKRPVAVKMLRPEYSGNTDVLARFRAEPRHAGSLSHPGIAQVYDYGEAGSPYFVMEFVNGPSLADLLDRGPLDPVRAADVIAQAAAALDTAHQAGVVHRDIKPANLLLGPGGVLKITDFGIAYAIGSAPVTDLGIVVGTAAYLAPERAAGASGSPSSDLYSLGIVGYECLSGRPPFDGSQSDIMAAHMYQALPPFPEHVPTGLADLVARLTTKDPRVRPDGAAQVAELAFKLRDAIAAGEDLPVGPALPMPTVETPATGHVLRDEMPGKARLGRRRRGLAAAAAASVTAGLAGWLIPGMLGASSLPAQAGAANKPSPSSAATPRTVRIDASGLIGLPLNTVLGRLRALGLRPLPEWAANKKLATGTVMGVTPSGPVTPGSTIVVLAAFQPGASPSPSSASSTGAGTSNHTSSPPPSISSSSGSSSSPGATSSPTPTPGISIGIGLLPGHQPGNTAIDADPDGPPPQRLTGRVRSGARSRRRRGHSHNSGPQAPRCRRHVGTARPRTARHAAIGIAGPKRMQDVLTHIPEETKQVALPRRVRLEDPRRGKHPDGVSPLVPRQLTRNAVLSHSGGEKRELDRVAKRTVEGSLRRLYRLRNIVLHGGAIQPVSLNATLRTAAPLVGAGLDRIAHAHLVRQVDPLALAAAAELRLKLAGTPEAPSITDLI
jgi:serine/threonine-protein kinase